MTAEQARAEAREILAEPRFSADGGEGGGDGLTGPIEDVLGTIGNWLDVAVPDAELSPDLSWLIWGVLAAAVVIGALHLARRAMDRRVRMAGDPERPGLSREAADPGALERAAAEAERSGDAARALRLRFEAGLLRLAAADAIRLRPSLTVRGAARQVRSPLLDELVVSFEGVVYGGRRPSEGESRAAREHWPRILSEAA